MYKNLIQSRLTPDERNGIFVAPGLPAVKLGKILMNDKRISQPGDVAAIHLDEGIFGRTAIIFTDTDCFYEGGTFPLAEIKFLKREGKNILISVNNLGALQEHNFKVANDIAAKSIYRLLEDISQQSGKIEAGEIIDSLIEYEGFDKAEVNWLKLRDELMKTIDLLYEKFNDGKISLLEYEEKKTELLNRL